METPVIDDCEFPDTDLWSHRAPDAVTVLIVDEHPAMREAVREVMETDGTISVVAAAGRITEAVSLAKLWEPEVAVLDVNLPGGGGWTAARRLREVVPDIRIVAYAPYADALITRMMMAAGAFAYITTGSDEALLLAAVRGEASPPPTGEERALAGRSTAGVAG
jgi:DNA-binding NarL/FixJ family response regulator